MSSIRVVPRIRIIWGREIALGPGKAELLEHIARTGSLREAAAAMKMSYMRAWTLVRTMNRCFKEPLVITRRGGADGGSARLTDTGKTILTAYRRMEARTLQATSAISRELSRRLR